MRAQLVICMNEQIPPLILWHGDICMKLWPIIPFGNTWRTVLHVAGESGCQILEPTQGLACLQCCHLRLEFEGEDRDSFKFE